MLLPPQTRKERLCRGSIQPVMGGGAWLAFRRYLQIQRVLQVTLGCALRVCVESCVLCCAAICVCFVCMCVLCVCVGDLGVCVECCVLRVCDECQCVLQVTC